MVKKFPVHVLVCIFLADKYYVTCLLNLMILQKSDGAYVELVSKELNPFRGITSFFRDRAPRRGHWQVVHRHLSVYPVPNLGKMLQSPQSDLTPGKVLIILINWVCLEKLIIQELLYIMLRARSISNKYKSKHIYWNICWL